MIGGEEGAARWSGGSRWIQGVAQVVIAAGVIGLVALVIDLRTMQAVLAQRVSDIAEDRYRASQAAADLARRDGEIAGLRTDLDGLREVLRLARDDIRALERTLPR